MLLMIIVEATLCRMLQVERFWRLLRHCVLGNNVFVKFRPFDTVETNWTYSICFYAPARFRESCTAASAENQQDWRRRAGTGWSLEMQ